MKERRRAYLPSDRLMALVSGVELPPTAEGSVLFADISGFTPLTEAYEAHLGSRKGGEELTRVLNEVYASLIGEVDRVQGSVIGFAGDAITCWFDGDDGLRAVNCAMGMQHGMERFKAVPSPDGGTIALGLKAAVTSGMVKRFIVGDSAFQLVDVLAGDPVYRVAGAEQMANRGEVVIDDLTRRALGSRVKTGEERTEPQGELTCFVVETVDPVQNLSGWEYFEELEIPEELVAPWIISAIRKRVASGLSEFFTELRPATAMFVKFEGIDFETDPEADRKLHKFFSAVQHIVSEYEGITHQLTVGDKGSFLYSAFGAPVSHEDDTLRAMAVALRIRELSSSLEFIRGVRIGIGRGTTRVGAYGGPTRRTYGVLGDQVNLAARLMGKAETGQILVSPTAALEAQQAYRLRALTPIRVKGKTEPVAVQELVGTLEGRSRLATDYAVPMVGRREELAQIGSVLNQALKGHGQVISIVADTGLGKTRLVDEGVRAARLHGFNLLHGECQTFGTNTPYTPWWPIWREFFGIDGNSSVEETERILRDRLSEIDPNLVPRLPVLAPVLNISFKENELTRTFDAKLRRASMESLLVECLRKRATLQPILIVLEDVHAIDVVSRDLLRGIVQAISRLPVVVIVAHRPADPHVAIGPDEQALDYIHQLTLKEFTAAESSELIRRKFTQLFGHEKALPREVIDRISGRTGGNPFFIEEVMNWMAHRKIDILSAKALDSEELPVSLHALVLSRMDQLEDSARVAMKVASVIGRIFRAAVLWGVYPDLGGESAVRKVLEVLAQRDFTERQDEGAELAYLFKHVVIHEVAYESLPHRLRQQIHESIGKFVEAHFPTETTQILDLLAFHYGRSTNTDKKREYFLRAGDAARHAYANAAAATYYTEVLPLLSKHQKAPVLRQLGHVLEVSGKWEQAMQIYQEGLTLATETGRLLHSANCQHDIGDLLRKRGSFEEARKWLSEARESFELVGNEEGLCQSMHSLGTLSAQTGAYDQAKELYLQSIEIRRSLGHELKVASLLSNLGIILRFQGNLKEALRMQQESLAIRERLNDPFHIGNSLNNLGMAKRYTGDLPGARADLEKALAILQKVGDRAEIANTLNSLAEVALDQQDTEACETYLQEGLQLARDVGNLQGIAFLLEAFASNAFFQWKPERCLRLFGAAQALRKSMGAPLPDADEARIEETIDLAGQSIRGRNGEDFLQEGAALPLSMALDYAAGISDAGL